jgi:hypothetical protein
LHEEEFTVLPKHIRQNRSSRPEDHIIRLPKSLIHHPLRSAGEVRMKVDPDIDISVYYDDVDASEFRLKALSELFDDRYDIKIFQQLPLPLRCRVLKGKILYSDDLSFCMTMPMKPLRNSSPSSAFTMITSE